MFLKKLIAPFSLPPGLFIVLLMVAAILAWRKRNRMAVAICLGMGALLWIFSTAPVADDLMQGLESNIQMPSAPDGDVILMLGGGLYAKAPDLSGIGVPSSTTMARLVTAARLQRRLGIPVVISGGRVFGASESISGVAGRYLLDLGIAPEKIILEQRSRDTYENALYCKEICDQKGFRKPLMVTSGVHIKRALVCFDKVGLKVTPIACATKTWPHRTYHWRHYLPSAGSLSAVSDALHEKIGLLYYRLRY